MSTLVVAAHPDDEVLGCGATIARLTQGGEDVRVLILGEGATSRYADRNDAAASETDALKAMANEAGRLLGVSEVAFGELADNRFDSVDLLEIVKLVESYLERWSPDAVYTHHSGDLNIDHTLTQRAVLTATRPASLARVERLYAFEILSATEASFGSLDGAFNPTVFNDVSESFNLKLDAMKAYASELREFPHPRSLEALTALATTRGAAVGVGKAEAFELLREVR